MKIRHALLSDATDLAWIHSQCFEVSWNNETFEACIENDVVVVADTPVAGFIVLRDAGFEAEILTLAVAPDKRRKQIASRILGFVTAPKFLARWRDIFLEVGVNNQAALALYTSHGFLPIGTRKNYYSHSDGTFEDAIVMSRSLATSANI